MHPIEGLVLHARVSYVAGEQVQPVLYRASMAEMVVPYGSSQQATGGRARSTAGDVGLGKMANSLELGCDCLGEIVYLDTVAVSEDESSHPLKNAICLHEEDYGILWKHSDPLNGVAETRRSRRMVVSFVATVGNYDYGFYWYFYQDGTIKERRSSSPGSSRPRRSRPALVSRTPTP